MIRHTQEPGTLERHQVRKSFLPENKTGHEGIRAARAGCSRVIRKEAKAGHRWCTRQARVLQMWSMNPQSSFVAESLMAS